MVTNFLHVNGHSGFYVHMKPQARDPDGIDKRIDCEGELLASIWYMLPVWSFSTRPPLFLAQGNRCIVWVIDKIHKFILSLSLGQNLT